ncbi:MAG: hypothetical protein J6X55_12190 [Victivallales bacterium]|nr:hypothetical protein [Victivallales bacterium]
MGDYVLENGHLRVKLAEDASHLTVESTKTFWRYEAEDYAVFTYGNAYTYNLANHAKAHVTQDGDSLHIVFDQMVYWVRFPEHGFKKPLNGPDLRFRLSIRLEDDEAIFTTESIKGLDNEIVAISFPHKPLRWRQSDRVNLVLGNEGCGSLVPFPGQPVFNITNRYELLPLYALYDDNGGIAVRYIEQFDHWTNWCFTEDACHVSTSQEFIRGIAEYSRSMRVSFLSPGENYVALAKNYRRHVQKEGRLYLLKDKIAANPEVGRLAGSVIWKFSVYWTENLPKGVTHDYSPHVLDKAAGDDEGKVANWTARSVFDTAHAAGFDRVCILNAGWNCYGYDTGYPTRFPVNAERGTAADFKACADYGRSLSEGYTLSVHDNYRDCYPESPEFDFNEMIRTEDGAPKRGSIWQGGRCYLICGSQGIKYAKRDMPRISELSGRGCIYIDVLGLTACEPCFHPDHPGSALDDGLWRKEVFREAKRCFGAVATEGNPREYLLDCIDLGAYICIHPWKGVLKAIPIPLWQLIYHDCVFNFAAIGNCGARGAEYRAYQALYTMLPSGFNENSLRVSRELRTTCLEEMVSHEFLDGNRQRTVFSDGTEIVANLTTGEWNATRP